MNNTLKQKGVLILYNEPAPEAPESDRGVLDEVGAVQDVLHALGYKVRLGGVMDILDIQRVLCAGTESVVFNLVEGFPGDPASATEVPSICRSLGREVTGGDTFCLTLTLDKHRTKALLAGTGISVPAGLLVSETVDLNNLSLDFPGPYIIKPAGMDASEGLFTESSVFERAGGELASALHRIHTDFKQDAMVEQLVGIREFNLSLIERDGVLSIMPVAEIDFSTFPDDKPRIVDYEAKWIPESFAYQNTPRIIPARVREKERLALENTARSVWEAVRCRDYARVDFRMDGDGQLYVLEVNANPDISPDAGFTAALEAGDVPFQRFVENVILNAWSRWCRRHEADSSAPHEPKGDRPRSGNAHVRPLQTEDRDRVVQIIEEMPLFRPDEREVAVEVLEESARLGEAAGYISLVVEREETIYGWACFGPTSCTLGTYDLYWIVVDQGERGGGYGSLLMEAVEDAVHRLGGRMIILDTSGQPGYELTRRFYLHMGYDETARVKDFYSPGDDKVEYAKYLSGLPD